MAVFPDGIKYFVNPSQDDPTTEPDHSIQHGDENDEITAIQLALGIGLSNVASTASVINKITIPAGSVKGDVLYFNGVVWTRLAPGTAGNYLQTDGPNANPVWNGDAVKGPSTNTNEYIPQWNGANSKLLKNGVMLDNDVGLVNSSPTRIATQHAVKTYVDQETSLIGALHWKFNTTTRYLEGWVDGVKRVEF